MKVSQTFVDLYRERSATELNMHGHNAVDRDRLMENGNVFDSEGLIRTMHVAELRKSN